MPAFRLNDQQLAAFERDGYVIVPKLYDAELMDLLLRVARADPEFVGKAHIMPDASGGQSKIAFTTELPKNVYGSFVHSQKIVTPMSQVLGGDVYHLHHKMMLKEPRIGGAWEWHQDYGYWYSDGFLFPHLGSCMIAVDRATKANGCLQVLRGSHQIGRIEHGRFGGQTGASPERVEEIKKKLDLVYVELEPGDALFFHCNTLHRSDANTSEFSRWSLICCYAATRNQPYRPSHAKYQFLEQWDDERIKDEARSHLATLQPAEA